jgi:hypothetical protein
VKAAFAFALGCLLGSADAGAASFLSCIDQTQSWSASYSGGQITSTTYIVSMPFVPAPPVVLIRLRSNQSTMGWLVGVNGPVDNPSYVPHGSPRNVNILISVPSNIASQYQGVANADSKFAQQRRSSHELWLWDGSYCPVLWEDAPFSTTGYPAWSH